MALMVPQNMIGIHKHAATLTAITYGIRSLLPIGYGMNQTGIGRLFQDLFGLLFGDLAAQAVIHDVVTQGTKMQANLQHVFAGVGIRIQVLSLAAGTKRDSAIILRINKLDHIFIGKDLAGVLYGLIYGNSAQAFGMGTGKLVHESVKEILI